MAAPSRQAVVRYFSNANKSLQGVLANSKGQQQRLLNFENKQDVLGKYAHCCTYQKFIYRNHKPPVTFASRSRRSPTQCVVGVNKPTPAADSQLDGHVFQFNPILTHKSLSTCKPCISQNETPKLVFQKSMMPNSLKTSKNFGFRQHVRGFCSSHIHRRNGSHDTIGNRRKDLMLMDFPQIIKPSFRKSINNFFMGVLIRGHYINEFTPASFLEGAQTAMTVISNLLSDGNFEALEGLVTDQALVKLRHNYSQMNDEEKSFIAVNPDDIIFRFIHEIGMIFDDDSDEKIVEITAVWHGIHGYADAKKTQEASPQEFWNNFPKHQESVNRNSFVTNYRFRKEVTKGVDDDWTVKILNHFTV